MWVFGTTIFKQNACQETIDIYLSVNSISYLKESANRILRMGVRTFNHQWQRRHIIFTDKQLTSGLENAIVRIVTGFLLSS
jgi:hypothetical protein